ncbi:uncharacterized protein LOC130757463 [Actinidia eriantha]|uniref:uncharacterized protein LOC130757463 n=1 Tax=Actinidia eriantha TaxID=165200 RepID=UPI00258CE3C0|nr:uncharacterized protein LOC130757463 [Actinidia eriantha]
MSANRGDGTSCEDKKGENVAFEDDNNEELEAICNDGKEDIDGIDYASMEGNALSSDPTEFDTDTEAHSKSGDPSSTPTKVNEFKFRKFLFEIQLTPNDFEKGGLFIPVETALDFVPPITASLQRFYYEKIKISTPSRTRAWSMAITYDPEECLFLINSRRWQQFAHRHGFKPSDIIRFFKPFPRVENTHFLIEHVKKADEEGTRSTVVVPEFKKKNFLFQKQLILYEVRNLNKRPLQLPKEEVKKHFSALRIPVPSHKMERLYFTDARNKEWCWKFMFLSGTYMVVDGWEGFVNEHKVDAGDAIRFYKFVDNRKLHPERHFLIQHVKKADVQVVHPPTDEDDAGKTSPISDQLGKIARKNGAVGTSTNTASTNTGKIVRRNVGTTAGTSTNLNAGQSGTMERNERNRGGESTSGRRESNRGGGRGGSNRQGGGWRGGRRGKNSGVGDCCMA